MRESYYIFSPFTSYIFHLLNLMDVHFVTWNFLEEGRKKKISKNPFVQEFKKETVNMVQGIHESFDQEFNMSSENKVHTDLKPDTKSEPKHEIGKMFANPEQEIHKFSCKICIKSYLSQKAMNQHLNVPQRKEIFLQILSKGIPLSASFTSPWNDSHRWTTLWL